MNREEMTMLGFEIVAYAGDARSKFLEALNAARDKNYEKAEKLIAEGKKCLNDAHNAQTEMLQKEAIGEDLSLCAGHGTNSVGDKPTTGIYHQV